MLGIEYDLLRLAWIGAHEQHARVAERQVGDLHRHRRAIDQDDLVAPVELVGLPGSKVSGTKASTMCARSGVCSAPSTSLKAVCGAPEIGFASRRSFQCASGANLWGERYDRT